MDDWEDMDITTALEYIENYPLETEGFDEIDDIIDVILKSEKSKVYVKKLFEIAVYHDVISQHFSGKCQR